VESSTNSQSKLPLVSSLLHDIYQGSVILTRSHRSPINSTSGASITNRIASRRVEDHTIHSITPRPNDWPTTSLPYGIQHVERQLIGSGGIAEEFNPEGWFEGKGAKGGLMSDGAADDRAVERSWACVEKYCAGGWLCASWCREGRRQGDDKWVQHSPDVRIVFRTLRKAIDGSNLVF